jgi:hypothetical protein
MAPGITGRGGSEYSRWQTDIRFDYRISPLLRPELLGDPQMGDFRAFAGVQGTNAPVPPSVAARLADLATPRLVQLGTALSPADASQFDATAHRCQPLRSRGIYGYRR